MSKWIMNLEMVAMPAGGREMEERQTLRQATKLWQDEIDPEFGRPYNDIGVYLIQRGKLAEAIPWPQKVRQPGPCEPRAIPLHEPGADWIATDNGQGSTDVAPAHAT